MKKVLVITYYWPPTGGSGVQRWVKFAKYLPAEGWEPVIYTPENPEQLVVDESLAAEVPSGIGVVKTHISEPYGIYHKLVGKKSDPVPDRLLISKKIGDLKQQYGIRTHYLETLLGLG